MLVALLLFCLPLPSPAMHFDQGVAMIPHPAKAQFGGEDAFFSSRKLLVVADGVGGWRNKGIDSGVFSRQLCSNAQRLFQKHPQLYSWNPKQLIIDSQKENRNPGSSTMVALTISNNQLKASYIGDSRYILIRDQQIIFEASQQQHGFNFPYQLASPESKFGSDPHSCLEFTHDVNSHDLIVVGSDGLFDNIFTRQIMEIIYKKGKFHNHRLVNKREIASYLCHHAIALGKQLKHISPFALNAHKHHKLWRGGKLDDTTVIIAQIILEKEREEQDSSSSTTSSNVEPEEIAAPTENGEL